MVQVIGHRGVAGLEPENTLRSFRRAIELGVDYLECDVHFTKDGQLAIIHDKTVDRTTNGTGPVGEYTLASIRELDAGKGERIPTLQEVLDLARGHVKLHVELKGEGAEAVVPSVVRERSMAEHVVLTCGNTDRLKRLRAAEPDFPFEHIFGDPPPDAIERALSVGASRISVNIRYATADYVRAAQSHGLLVIAWPPNTEEEMRRMLDLGVDMICTDRADLLLALLGR